MAQQAVSANIISNFNCWNIYPKNRRNKDKSSYDTDKVASTQIWKLIFCLLGNFKIQQ